MLDIQETALSFLVVMHLLVAKASVIMNGIKIS